MSIRNKNTHGSPMDEVFTWATPRSSQQDVEPACKRKCDDSGYASCSSGTKSCNILDTPDSNIKYITPESVYTPCMQENTQGVKKRIFNKTEENSSNYNCTLPVVDSYTDFITDASLYNEPMDVSPKDSTLCLITEESDSSSSLGVTEISKKIDVNLEIEKCATPLKLVDSPKRKSRTPIKKKYLRQRSLHGFEKVDIMFQLGERKNYGLIVSKILSYLPDNDISNMTMVSSTWRNICLKDSRARSRWYKYKEYLKERKENLNVSEKKLKRSQTPLIVRNHSTPFHVRQPKSPPISPSKFRFHLFQKEARNLKEDEVLMECPRCTRPSACSPATLVGECRGIACMLRFCTVCRTPAHDGSPCPYLTPVTPTKRTQTTIGSKESKRYLRRL